MITNESKLRTYPSRPKNVIRADSESEMPGSEL
jgi:hypothetical protein